MRTIAIVDAQREEAAYIWTEIKAGRYAGCPQVNYRVQRAEALRYPVLRITFDDGLSGECDLSHVLDEGPIVQRLRDDGYFRTVAPAANGPTFGWNLDHVGHEIDFCPDAARIAIAAGQVEELAARHRSKLTAFE